MEGVRTGKIGEGRYFVTHVDEVDRIRTGQTDKLAAWIEIYAQLCADPLAM
jgi:nitrogen regulatory protein PII